MGGYKKVTNMKYNLNLNPKPLEQMSSGLFPFSKDKEERVEYEYTVCCWICVFIFLVWGVLIIAVSTSTESHGLSCLHDPTNVNYFFFDYDNTLNVNGDTGLSRQLRDTINQTYPNGSTNINIVIDTLHQNINFASEIVNSFGGSDRINRLRDMFSYLSKNNKHVYICSTSWYPITAAQWKTYLYYIMNFNGIPLDSQHILALPAIPGSTASQKGQTIYNVMLTNSQQYNNAIFYDDGLVNIQSAIGVCITRWLSRHMGMKSIDISDVIRYSGEATCAS